MCFSSFRVVMVIIILLSGKTNLTTGVIVYTGMLVYMDATRRCCVGFCMIC